MTIYDAAERYRAEGVPLVVIAGREYGSGSSRDWAAKGSALLGVRAVIAQSFERIHRSNLVALGVIPLQFADGESAESLGLTGTETFTIRGLADLDVGSHVRGRRRRRRALVHLPGAARRARRRQGLPGGGLLQMVMPSSWRKAALRWSRDSGRRSRAALGAEPCISSPRSCGRTSATA